VLQAAASAKLSVGIGCQTAVLLTTAQLTLPNTQTSRASKGERQNKNGRRFGGDNGITLSHNPRPLTSDLPALQPLDIAEALPECGPHSKRRMAAFLYIMPINMRVFGFPAERRIPRA
jgi:hypothetical protein